MHNPPPQGAQTFAFRKTSASQPGITRKPTSLRDGVPTAGPSIEVPAPLESYLTTTSQPHEIYSTLQDSRERRLRLLLRRFTNQIQYGCKNPYCDIPTCFSFRKRSSQVPIRPYNDLTARSLAWRCVEDYASSGKPFCPSEQHASNHKKGKGKVKSGDKKDGLCRNEPVVPWYQDPAEHAPTRRIGIGRRATSEVKLRHDSPRLSRSNSTVDTAPSQEKSLTGSEAYPSQANYQKAAEHIEKDQKPDDHEESRKEHRPSRIAESKHEHASHQSSTASKKCSVTFETAGPLEESQPLPKKDSTSFPQSFYDTLSVKNLEVLATVVTNTPPAETVEIMQVTQKEKKPTDPDTGSSCQSSTKIVRPVHTFKLLPTSALIWLRHVISRQAHRHVTTEADVNYDTEHQTDLDRFARQCLHFCLSNPHRLLKSAHMWHYDKAHRSIKKEPSDSKALVMLQEIVTQIASHETIPVTSSEFRLPPMQNSLQAFTLLARIQPYPEILDQLFASLQYAYVLPPTLKRSNLSSRRTSVNALEGEVPRMNPRISQPTYNEAFSTTTFLDDDQTASLCMLVLMAMFRGDERLVSTPLSAWDKNSLGSKVDYLICRDFGTVFPHSHVFHAFPRSTDRQWRTKYRGILLLIDAHDNPSYLRLLESFADVLSHRLALTEVLRSTKNVATASDKSNVVEKIINLLLTLEEPFDDASVCHTAWLLLELMCLLLLKKWDRNPIVQRTGPVSGVLQMMAALYRSRTKLGMPAVNFSCNFVADAFDCVKTPLQWLAFREDSKHIHMLSYSFLFDSATLVKYFRAINIEIMRKSHQYAQLNQQDVRRFLSQEDIPLYGGKEMLATLRPHMALYFVLTAKRASLLEDAINQIWRRQRQELMRPLKVILGKGEGEDGLDHGGVQQEFFRLVFAEILNPDYGMFTIDDRTRMAWFQPGSLEPLYKFEAVGILMSLAVYNGITLPVTFPLAFYRKLLGLKVKQLDQIEDGWPELTKGLTILRDWEDGDVGDVIARTYEFSYEIFGSNVTIDMTKVNRDDHWPPLERRKSKDRVKTATFEMFHHDIPTPPSEADQSNGKLSPRPFRLLRSSSHDLPRSPTPLSILSSNTSLLASIPSSPTSPAPPEEAPLVTNANRNKYIKDYIFWLTNKSISPQYEAFAKGFYTCLDPTALSIFTPEALKSVVEGYNEIDIEGLRAAATYEEYTTTDQIIIDFWSVVRDFSPEQHKRLLEFVTASERVPVNGIKSVMFLIQRNGAGDERLPSSATCYGRLLLPQYSSKEILREKLAKAIENSVGFGSL